MIYLNICKTLHNICEMEKKLQQLLHLHKKFVFLVTDLFKIISSKSVSVCVSTRLNTMGGWTTN
jgi:hypothetical protein